MTKLQNKHFYVATDRTTHRQELVRMMGYVESGTFEDMLGYQAFDHHGRLYTTNSNFSQGETGTLTIEGYPSDGFGKANQKANQIVEALADRYIDPSDIQHYVFEHQFPEKYSLAEHDGFALRVGGTYVTRMGFIVRIHQVGRVVFKNGSYTGNAYGDADSRLWYTASGKRLSSDLPLSIPSMLDIAYEVMDAPLQFNDALAKAGTKLTEDPQGTSRVISETPDMRVTEVSVNINNTVADSQAEIARIFEQIKPQIEARIASENADDAIVKVPGEADTLLDAGVMAQTLRICNKDLGVTFEKKGDVYFISTLHFNYPDDLGGGEGIPYPNLEKARPDEVVGSILRRFADGWLNP